MNDRFDKSRPETPAQPQRPTVDVETLLAGGREMTLVYRGCEYRLRLTRNSKLILTK